MSEGLDVGTLTGRIELEDRLTNALEQVGGALDKFQKGFKDAGSTILEQATGFFTAEAAIHAVEGALHLGIETLKEMTTEGAKISDVEENFQHLTAASGRLGSTLLNELRQGTHNTISDFELMKSANDALAIGVNITDQQYRTLANGAFNLAQAKGMDVKQAFDLINDSMASGVTRGLRALDIKISQTKAEDDYAAKLHTTAERLTEDEKLQASREAILNAVGAATKRLGDQTDGMDEKVDQARVIWSNFMEELSKTVATSPVLLAAFDGIRGALTEAFGGSQESLVKNISLAINQAAIDVMSFAEEAADAAGVIGVEWNAAKVVFKDIEQIISGNVLVFKSLSGAVADFGAMLHLPGAAESVARIDKEIENLENAMMERGKSIQADKTAQEEWAVATGNVKDKIEEIRQKMIAAQDALKAHTDETKNTTEAANNAAKATGDQAASTETLGNNSRMTKDEIKKLNEAMTEINSVSKGWQGTLDSISGDTVEAIKYYLDAGVALDKLATAYGLTQTQATAVERVWKQGTEALKEQIKAANEIGDAWTKYYDELAALSRTDLENANAASLQKYQDAIKKLQDAGVENKKFYDDLWALYQADIQKNDQTLTQKDSRSKSYLEQQLRASEETYDRMRQHSDQFTQADIQNQGKIVSSLKDMLSHWGQINSVIDKQKELVKTLSGEVLTLKEYEAKQAAGGSLEVTSANFMQETGVFGLNYTNALKLAKLGYSFQEILQLLQGQGGAMPANLPSPHGPKIPGFRDGGIGDFGEGTLAVLHGHEAVVPLDQSTNFGSTNITFYVNGTGRDVAQQVKDMLMQDLRLRKQFSALR